MDNSDVTAGYIITDVERLRKPMQQITDYILSKCSNAEQFSTNLYVRGMNEIPVGSEY